MTNAQMNRNRRWKKFAELNAKSFYCTSQLAKWAENGVLNGFHDPNINKSDYNRTNCGRCNKCDEITEKPESEINDPEYWKRKAFDLAKAYGTSLAHLDELKIENTRLKADIRILQDIVRIDSL